MDFHRGLPGYAPTPLIDLPPLAAELGVGRVVVKDESSRLGLPAFKILGASWAVAQVLAQRFGVPVSVDRLKAAVAGSSLTLVTATDGNHGRAVARMASVLGLSAHVVVPRAVPEPIVDAIAGEGAFIERIDGDYDSAIRVAARVPGGLLVQDAAWDGYEQVPAWIVDGYATMLLELDDAGLRPDVVVVPVGVGSLAQAVVAHYRSRPWGSPVVLSVEPVAAACVLASLHAGALRSVPTADTVMNGLNCGTPSSIAWPYLRDGVDVAVAVDDDASCRAVADLRSLGVSAGPSGAATLAGVRTAALELAPDAVVVLLNTEASHTP